MNLKNNKGYVGIDASVAVLVLIIIIPTIAGMIYNVNKSNKLIERKTEAVSIAVNTIETIKGIGIDVINDENFNEEVVTAKLSEIYTLTDDDTPEIVLINDENTVFDDKIQLIKGIVLTKDDNTYKIEIKIQDYADTVEGKEKSADYGDVKIVKAKVTYRSGKQEKSVELKTVIS